MQKIKVGVVGLGYWGPNYVRNFHKHPQVDTVYCCDLSESALLKIKHHYPLLHITKNYQDLIDNPEIDIIAIATPPISHFKIASDALKAGKHVLLAKPLTTNLSDAKELLRLAKKGGLLMHSDLTYLYSNPVNYIKDAVDKDKLGKPVFYDSIRSNAGPIRNDANVIWDLAPHDLAILDHIFHLKPKSVLATGSKHYKKSTTEEMAHIALTFPNDFVAHIHMSWLSPVKMRAITLSGTKQMIHFDDVQPEDKIRVYDSQIIEVKEKSSARKLFYRNGDVLIPKLKTDEALFIEFDEIINQILNDKIDYLNAKISLGVIEILEACDRSIKEKRLIRL
ncbi:hypothetical protein A3C32_04370 [Candidatus Daviesbacteria bacterium RIFCSPHIGHO2_02_FULL_41_14]|uniref:Oxidoreductase n=1 Tax=Candidatus Daviesbacteria bacterium RIFCSPLOWO2_01_FULL_40_24 TaxID=1797787 RepID=A0A1F5MJC9_9BACT|nr:MAG: hypothetical protein A3C32_04370 [Candidatus Daviesbacteria bacterium RIFCSPHIGHO2_02_FULL_41_14]OGE65462.1 MAG: hypothetical protein A3B49_01065 [Candidatus Daviesbacteria bacterium RIFCSPLOWO2_01_FULL_40_24]